MNSPERFKIRSFLLLSIFLIQPPFAVNMVDHQEEDEKCKRFDVPRQSVSISEEYNKDQLPWTSATANNSAPEPVKVFVGGVVQNIAPIVASETEFRVNIKFVLKWMDMRLSTEEDSCNIADPNILLLSDKAARLIWLPSPYITNAKYEEIQKLNRRLLSVRVSNTGMVTLIMVVNATVDCGMNFRWYPMDTQVCPLSMESFLYDNAFVEYNWLESSPFQLIPRGLLQYDVDHILKYTKTLSYRKHLDRNFTRLTAHFRFVRLWGNHCIQTFVPCTLIVSLSWFSFWLELDATSARASLLATAMLTLVTQFLSLRATLPPVAYVKAVDIWMFGCMLAIFGAVAEFALVKTLYSITEEIRRGNSVQVLSPMSFISRQSTCNSDHSGYNRDLYDHLNYVLHPIYKKNRLGSVVLSGRSTATYDLPSRVEWPIFFGKICIPLIWTTTPKVASRDSAVDADCTSQKILLWQQVDTVSKVLFPISFSIFSITYWIVLVMFGGCTSIEA